MSNNMILRCIFCVSYLFLVISINAVKRDVLDEKNVFKTSIIFPNFLSNSSSRANLISIFDNKNKTYSFKKLVKKKSPFLIKRDPKLKSWPALKWNLFDLSLNKIEALYGVLQITDNSYDHNTKNFLIFENDYQADQINLFDKKISRPQIIDRLDFYNFLQNATTSRSKYFFSENYSELEKIAKMENDTSWRSYLFTLSEVKKKGISSKNIAPFINIIYPGASLQARYSEYHSSIIQLKGKTRYIIFPPESIKKLYLFPSIHTANKQSQVDFYDLRKSNKSFPLAMSAKRFEVILHPGQLLYVPAFWVVHTESITLSLSIHVLSASLEQILANQALELTVLPEKEKISKGERIIFAQVFLVYVLSRIQGISSIKKFSRSLYEQRFKYIFPPQGLYLLSSSFTCFKDYPDEYNSIIRSLNKNLITKNTEKISKIFNNPALSNAIKWVLIGNFVEFIARWAMDKADDSVLFIKECLDMDSKIKVFEEEVPGPSVIKLDPYDEL